MDENIEFLVFLCANSGKITLLLAAKAQQK